MKGKIVFRVTCQIKKMNFHKISWKQVQQIREMNAQNKDNIKAEIFQSQNSPPLARRNLTSFVNSHHKIPMLKATISRLLPLVLIIRPIWLNLVLAPIWRGCWVREYTRQPYPYFFLRGWFELTSSDPTVSEFTVEPSRPFQTHMTYLEKF